MRLTLTTEVVTLLSTQGATFLLTLNDGSNPFSSAEGCCMIGERFLIVATDKIPENYSIQIFSNPLTFYTSEYDCLFLTEDLRLEVNNASQTLLLRDKSGILDYNVQIKHV